MQIEQPTFPLTRDAFAAALRMGHGRAKQQIDRYGSTELEDKIIEACVSCLSYDPQCEAARAPWLVSIVNGVNLDAKVTQAIAAMIQEPPPENHRDMDQRSAILKELAAAGSEVARRLLYLSLTRMSHTSDVIGADQIVALDGAKGLIHVARQLGRWSQADPDFWLDDQFTAQFDASAGTGAGLAVLERETEIDQDVAGYLAGMRKARESQSRTSSRRFDGTGYSGADVVAHVHNHPKDQCHWLRLWGAQAASDQHEVVFAALLVSNKPEQVKRLFRSFGKTGVPRFDNRLLQWIAHPDKRLRWAALNALAPLEHLELRQVALQQIADGEMAFGVALLVKNFEAGDLTLCAESLQKLEDADDAHSLLGSLLDLCEAHPGAEALDCLLCVHELSPCSTCRKRAVQAMTATNTAPQWVLTEAALDADPDTRALAVATSS